MNKGEIKSSRLVVACSPDFHDEVLAKLKELGLKGNDFSSFCRMAILHELKRIHKDLNA